ncbi:MAG: ATP-dependent Clp protease adaptor ClpS [Acidimicrobiia bacterium]|nr:ATP-dependent Clp protease adaptor ClpS [Acidimicrobiia bacterium]
MPKPRDATLTRAREDVAVERPRLWRVLLHNDDYTTQEFVVWLLETVFQKPQAEAFTIMMSVHRSGLGVAGVYTRDVADTKLQRTKELAERHEFPLRASIEPQEEAAT